MDLNVQVEGNDLSPQPINLPTGAPGLSEGHCQLPTEFKLLVSPIP
jgi:hypothetical protein